MKRHEDQLFETYREAFAQYEAPAPAGTLAAVHKKMNKTGFWYFSWTSLNVYTLSVLIAAGLAFSLFAYEGDESSALAFTPKAKDLSLAAQSSATVVVLMGMRKLPEIVQLYRTHGLANTPIAIIQSGSTMNEKTGFGRMDTIMDVVAEEGLKSPAIIVIGEVVSTHPKAAIELAKKQTH